MLVIGDTGRLHYIILLLYLINRQSIATTSLQLTPIVTTSELALKPEPGACYHIWWFIYTSFLLRVANRLMAAIILYHSQNKIICWQEVATD